MMMQTVPGRSANAIDVWRADPGRCRGDLGTRHSLWGRREIAIQVRDGELRRGVNGVCQLAIELVANPRRTAPDGPVVLSFRGNEMGRGDVARVYVNGSVGVGSHTGPLMLLVHDLGRASDPVHGERAFLTLRGRLAAREWHRHLRGLWHPLLVGRELEIFCHTEWLPVHGLPDAA